MSLLSENDINSSVSVSNLEEIISCSSPYPLFTNYFPDSPQMHFEYDHVYLQFLESAFHQQQYIFTSTTNTSDAYATSDLDNNINNMFDNEGSSKTEEEVREEQEEDVVPIRKMEYDNNNNNKNNNIVTRNSKKDRHSKINTARGPRDRRMRLSLEVARKFFDLQDMLRFDKPSKTVDWLLKHSSHAIRELTECNSCEAVSSITSNSDELGHSVNNSSSDPFLKKQKIASLEGEKQASSCDKRKIIRKQKAEKKTRLARTVERESRRRARERARERTSQKRRLCETNIVMYDYLCRSSS